MSTNDFSEFARTIFMHAIKKDLYPYQERVLQAEQSKVICNKSRQTGISTIAALKGLLLALAGQTVLLVSPSNRQSKHLMDYVRQFLIVMRELEWQQDNNWHKLKMPAIEENKTGMMFPNGGQIHSLPNSASTIRGFKADFVVLDEFAHFLNETDKEVWDAILPSTSRGGKVLVISTPLGEQNLYRKFWMEDKTFTKVLINYRDCPDLNINEIRESMDETSFAQEYDNAFLGDIDSYFPYGLIKECINPELPTDDMSVSIIGVDFARKYDLTAIVGARRIYEGSVSNIKEYEVRLVQARRNVPFAEQVNAVKKLILKQEVERCTLDAGGLGMPLAEQLQREHSAKVRSVMFTNEIKQTLMTSLKRLMEQKKVKLPNDTRLINSLHAIRLKQTESARFIFDSPRDEEIGHADIAWALALALHDEVRQKPALRIY